MRGYTGPYYYCQYGQLLRGRSPLLIPAVPAPVSPAVSAEVANSTDAGFILGGDDGAGDGSAAGTAIEGDTGSSAGDAHTTNAGSGQSFMKLSISAFPIATLTKNELYWLM